MQKTDSPTLKALLQREERIFYLTIAGLFVALIGGVFFIATAETWENKFEVFKSTMTNISLPILIPYVTKKTIEEVARLWPRQNKTND
jgi:hypothetical protein